MPALRRAKRESALLIALADIGGIWDVVAATEALTRFADAAVRAALAFLLRKHARAGLLALDADAPDPRERLRPGRAGARQAWRARAQLFERRRPYRALRPCGRLDSARDGAGADVRAPNASAGAPHAGADERRLRVAGRPAPAARPGLDAGRALDCRAPINITRRSARTGSARRSSKRARRRATSSLASASSPTSRRSSGASISTMRRSPTSTR